MEDQTVHFCHILLFYFHKGKNARQDCETLRKIYGDNALKERANDGLRNSVLVILILTTLLGQEGSPR